MFYGIVPFCVLLTLRNCGGGLTFPVFDLNVVCLNLASFPLNRNDIGLAFDGGELPTRGKLVKSIFANSI